MKSTTYHVGGFIPGAAAENKKEEADSQAGTYTTWDVNGNQTSVRALTSTEATEFAAAEARSVAITNANTIRTKATQALTANATYLAIPAPTATEVRSQTELLTREVNGLIRLLLNQLDDISDT